MNKVEIFDFLEGITGTPCVLFPNLHNSGQFKDSTLVLHV